jgi:hypothetical protein
VQQLPKAAGIGHVGEMEAEAAAVFVEIAIDAIQTVGIEAAGAPFESVDFIALPQQEFGQVGAVLAGDAGNECAFHSLP